MRKYEINKCSIPRTLTQNICEKQIMKKIIIGLYDMGDSCDVIKLARVSWFIKIFKNDIIK